ncbi:M23 family metallopeptidase [Paraburkholderia sacchari]|uniref:Peptidase M23 n=2 Tax=Paraburkholderia sacchari TaxID=159450 RepID=A0A8T6Z5A8_9BURK|nr:peptidase M23 [Paraburkholderia sacchari]NLP59962.1 peptidase M23 [Paraburkholderia sacchari]
MIISPPFLPQSGLTSSDASKPDPMMDAVDKFELAHGIYPVAFDRRWHCGVHLAPDTHGAVYAIADGEVVAYRVCQHAIGSGVSNAGFVLLRHATETGDGRKLTFYSLYMHLLPLAEYFTFGYDATGLADFLCKPTGDVAQGQVAPAVAGGNHKVRRKDIVGYLGRYQGIVYLHCEVFMMPGDFDAYFGHTQLGNTSPDTPATADCWGHTYYTIPAGQQFFALPPGTDAHNKLHGIKFEPGQVGTNTLPLVVETYFSKGAKYTNVWSVAADGSRALLTDQPVAEKDYEYDLYRRATALYGTCPSDGYEMLRFGRILSTPATLSGAACTTWVQVTYAAGKRGYVDISNAGVKKLSDADFPSFMGWQKLSEGNTPFSNDGMCDIDALRKLVKDAADSEQPTVSTATTEVQKADALSSYVRGNDGVRQALRGFICNAPSEWDSTNNNTRYTKLLDEGGFYHGNEAGYTKFLNYLKEIQFWDVTGLPAGEKLWFFHPLSFIRHFRKCGWLDLDELAATFPRYPFYTESGSPRRAIAIDNDTYRVKLSIARQRIQNHAVALNHCFRKYLGNNSKRISLFLAQVLLETAQWRNLGGTRRLMHEWGFGQYSAANPATQYYGPFYGHGIMQLTWAGNFDAYGTYRVIPNNTTGSYVERLPNSHHRITATSQHYSANPGDGGHFMLWAPRFDPDVIAENAEYACDSGGFYWVSKYFSQGFNINRVVDKDFSASSVGFVNRLVNGGGNGYYERQAYSVFISRVLGDEIGVDETVLINPPHPKSAVLANMLRPE